MDNPCTTRVWKQSNQKGSALLLLLAIADHAGENGLAFPSLPALARAARFQEGRFTLTPELRDNCFRENFPALTPDLAAREPKRSPNSDSPAPHRWLFLKRIPCPSPSTLCPLPFCDIIGPASPDPGLPGQSILNIDD